MITNSFQTIRSLTRNIFQGPLDRISDSSVAGFSLRKLRLGYTQNCISLRRSSDNVETDIGFKFYAPRVYPYWIDEESALEHVNSGNTTLLGDVTGYTAVNSTATANAPITGQITLIENSVNNLHRMTKPLTGNLVSGTQYIYSTVIRRTGPQSRDLWFEIANSTFTFQIAINFRFNTPSTTETISVIGATGVSARIRLLSAGVWLCEIIFTPSANYSSVSVYPALLEQGTGNTRLYVGDNISGLIFSRPGVYVAATEAGGFISAWYNQSINSINPIQLAKNSFFQTDTQWSKGSGVIISEGVATITNGTILVGQDMGLVTGKTYTFTIRFYKTGDGTLGKIRVTTNTVATSEGSSFVESSVNELNQRVTFTGQIVANGPAFIIGAASQTFSGRIESVSVKENINTTEAKQDDWALQPRIINAGIIETAGLRPTIRWLGGGQYLDITIPAFNTKNLSLNHVMTVDSANGASEWSRGMSLSRPGVASWITAGCMTTTINSSSAAFGVENADAGYFITNPITLGVPFSFTICASATQHLGSINGVETVYTPLTAADTWNFTVIRLGREVANVANTFLNGSISEAMLFSSTLTLADRWTLERDQGAAYGISVV